MTSTTQEELRSLFWSINMIQEVYQKRRCSPDWANTYKRVCIEFTLSFQRLVVAHWTCWGSLWIPLEISVQIKLSQTWGIRSGDLSLERLGKEQIASGLHQWNNCKLRSSSSDRCWWALPQWSSEFSVGVVGEQAVLQQSHHQCCWGVVEGIAHQWSRWQWWLMMQLRYTMGCMAPLQDEYLNCPWRRSAGCRG